MVNTIICRLLILSMVLLVINNMTAAPSNRDKSAWRMLISHFPLEILLLPHLSAAKYIWVIDSDMSLSTKQHLQLPWLRQLHQCGLGEGVQYPPLVAQPLIYEHNRHYPFLSRHAWLTTLCGTTSYSNSSYSNSTHQLQQ